MQALIKRPPRSCLPPLHCRPAVAITGWRLGRGQVRQGQGPQPPYKASQLASQAHRCSEPAQCPAAGGAGPCGDLRPPRAMLGPLLLLVSGGAALLSAAGE